MVGADGGGGDEAHRGAVEQRGVAACARPDDKSFGIDYCITGDRPGRQKKRFYGELRQKRSYMRNLVFDNQFHTAAIHAKNPTYTTGSARTSR